MGDSGQRDERHRSIVWDGESEAQTPITTSPGDTWASRGSTRETHEESAGGPEALDQTSPRASLDRLVET